MNDQLQARLLAADAVAERPPIRPVRVTDLIARARRRAMRRGLAATCAIAMSALVWPLVTPAPGLASGPASSPGLAELQLRVRALLEVSAPDPVAIRGLEAAHVRAITSAERALALAAPVSTPK